MSISDTIGDIITDGINDFLDDSRSPVSGGRYKSTKADDSPSQLHESGAMRSDIEFEYNGANTIEVGLFSDAGEDEITKAYAHNTGFKGHPHLAGDKHKREFIPTHNGTFKKPILDKIKKVISNKLSQKPKRLKELLDAADEITVTRVEASSSSLGILFGGDDGES